MLNNYLKGLIYKALEPQLKSTGIMIRAVNLPKQGTAMWNALKLGQAQGRGIIDREDGQTEAEMGPIYWWTGMRLKDSMCNYKQLRRTEPSIHHLILEEKMMSSNRGGR